MSQAPVKQRLFGLYCPDCGGPITEKEAFCRRCGANLDEPIEQDEFIIPGLDDSFRRESYAIEWKGRKRLLIAWKKGLGRWDGLVYFDGKAIGTIPNKLTLDAGKEFKLPDGSTIIIQWDTNVGVSVIRDSQPAPTPASLSVSNLATPPALRSVDPPVLRPATPLGPKPFVPPVPGPVTPPTLRSTAQPVLKKSAQPAVKTPPDPIALCKGAYEYAYGMVFFIGGLNLILGLVNVIFNLKILGNGLYLIGFGLVFLLLGFLVKQKYVIALYLAVAIFGLDGIVAVILMLSNRNFMGISFLIMRIIFITPMYKGIEAINTMKKNRE
jgi:hypothetical protein